MVWSSCDLFIVFALLSLIVELYGLPQQFDGILIDRPSGQSCAVAQVSDRGGPRF